MDQIGTRTAVDFVRFAVSRIEGIVARTSIENVPARTPVKDIITLITKYSDIAIHRVVAPTTYQAVVEVATQTLVRLGYIV